MKYRREIDGLRALAVLPVMLFHAGFETFRGGFVGVDIFFVISGYLITTIILAELERGKFSIVEFYERRARRILPAMFVVLLVCIPCAWLWLLPSDMKEFSRSLIAVSLFSSNILFWRESGYFDTAAELKPLLHTWSLAVEEQFYLVFPLLLMLLWKRGRRLTIVLLVLILIVSLAVAQWGSLVKPVPAFYLLPTRSWELLMGGLAAIYLSTPNRRDLGHSVKEIGGWLGIALILYAVFAYSRYTPFPGLFAVVPTSGALLIITMTSEQTSAGRFIGSRIFVGLGLISYSAYLWHQPILAFYRRLHLPEARIAYLGLLGATLVIAYISWAVVERPFRLRSNFTRKSIFSISALLMASFIGFGLYGDRSEGFSSREHMQIFKDLAYDPSKLGYLECNDELTNSNPRLNYCMSGKSSSNALIIGDSHADDKFPGIEKFARNYDWKLVGNSSCPPLIGVISRSADGTDCTDRLKKLFAYIDKDTSVKLVVLTFMQSYPLDTLIAADHIQHRFKPEDFRFTDESTPQLNKVDTFYTGLQRTVEFLQARGIKTVILLDIPELEVFPSDCLEKSADCEFSRKAALTRQEILRERVSRLKTNHASLGVFDPLDIFCPGPGDHCSILKDGRSLYRDSHHLSLFGSGEYGKVFAAWLAEQH